MEWKKFTQCKTSCSFKIDVFEMPHNKSIRKCFQNISRFFWIKLQFLWTETPLQYNPHHFIHRFPYFVLPHSATRHHNYWIYQTICQAKSINLLSKVYTDHNTLLVKHAAHQKVESSRTALFQSYTTRSTTALSSIQNTLNSLQNVRGSFIFRALFAHTTTPTFSTKNPFVYFS